MEDEEKRFARYAARMKELGGCKIWNWSAADVEARLVKLGYEEPKMDDDSRRRNRKRNAYNKRRANARQELQYGWHNMPGMHQPQYPLPQLGGPQQATNRSSYDMMSDTVSTGLPQYTSDQENDLLEQLERKYADDDQISLSDVKAETEYSMSLDDQQHQQNAEVTGTAGVNHLHSERVARQACEQLIHRYRADSPYAPAS